MSFQRVGGPVRRKAPTKKKPDWDASVNDLTAYKATPEEIVYRKESHKSKNHISVKLDKMKKEGIRRKLTGVEAKQLAIMKEVLYDQQQFENIVAKSDSMMAVVKDLFGDDPKRFTGFPNVTTAPGGETTNGTFNGSQSLVASIPDIYTKSEKLSDTIMNQHALNDLDSDEDSDTDEEQVGNPEPISYQSKINLQRFQEYLQEEEKKSVQQDPPSLVSELYNPKPTVQPSKNNDLVKKPPLNPELLAALLEHSRSDSGQQDKQLMDFLFATLANKELTAKSPPSPKTPPNSVPPPCDRAPPSAINDTKRIKKTKKHVNPDEPNSTANMNDMKRILHELEIELSQYEHQTGRHPQGALDGSDTFSGYTAALVGAVSRLTRYLKETDLRIRTEVTLREQLTQDVYQLRTIIDALATDLIVTQEEYGKLYSEYSRFKESTQESISSLKTQVMEMKEDAAKSRLQAPSDGNSAGSQSNVIQDKEQQLFTVLINSSCKSDDNKTSSPLPSHFGSSARSEFQTLPPNLPASSPPVSSLSAVMLSPPVRRTRVFTEAKLASTEEQVLSEDVSKLSTKLGHIDSEPQRFTTEPPVITSVSVPRPTPLVQSNVTVPIKTSGVTVHQNRTENFQMQGEGIGGPLEEGNLSQLVKLGDQTAQQISQLKEMAVEEALNNPAMQTLMQSQIAELNRQQDEARGRLRELLHSQKFQQEQLQQQIGDMVLLDTNNSSVAFEKLADAVSPPISPILQTNDKPTSQHTESLPQLIKGRGITVSLPLADLDVST